MDVDEDEESNDGNKPNMINGNHHHHQNCEHQDFMMLAGVIDQVTLVSNGNIHPFEPTSEMSSSSNNEFVCQIAHNVTSETMEQIDIDESNNTNNNFNNKVKNIEFPLKDATTKLECEPQDEK